jgi:hypothetical protein
MSADIQIDAFPPAKMAARMEDVGVNKAKLNFPTQATLAILAAHLSPAAQSLPPQSVQEASPSRRPRETPLLPPHYPTA